MALLSWVLQSYKPQDIGVESKSNNELMQGEHRQTTGAEIVDRAGFGPLRDNGDDLGMCAKRRKGVAGADALRPAWRHHIGQRR